MSRPCLHPTNGTERHIARMKNMALGTKKPFLCNVALMQLEMRQWRPDAGTKHNAVRARLRTAGILLSAKTKFVSLSGTPLQPPQLTKTLWQWPALSIPAPACTTMQISCVWPIPLCTSRDNNLRSELLAKLWMVTRYARLFDMCHTWQTQRWTALKRHPDKQTNRHPTNPSNDKTVLIFHKSISPKLLEVSSHGYCQFVQERQPSEISVVILNARYKIVSQATKLTSMRYTTHAAQLWGGNGTMCTWLSDMHVN